LIPVTGQPLPLISRGGTSTLITCAYFGIILSADRFGSTKKKGENAVSQNDKDSNNNENDSDGTDVEMKDSDKSLELEEKVEFEIIRL